MNDYFATICTMRFFGSLLIVVALVLIDQFSKSYLIDFLKTKPGYMLNVTPFLDIEYTWNYGKSFGLSGRAARAKTGTRSNPIAGVWASSSWSPG
jgi:lipoprotein signal peptidase